MKLKIFSIYDSKAEAYNTPFFMFNDAMAERTFRQMLEDDQSEISKAPSDYSLFTLGTYDGITGAIEPANKLVCEGKAVAPLKVVNDG